MAEYSEEESFQRGPIDDKFCEAVETSLHQAVAPAIEPLEHCLLALAEVCPFPLNEPPTTHKGACKSDTGIDLRAFDCLKKVFLSQPTSPGGDTPAASKEAPLSLHPDDDDHAGDSPDEMGPSRPWFPSQSLGDQREDVSDMLGPEDLIHPRSAEWTPMDKVAKYVASQLRMSIDKEFRACLKAEYPRSSLPGKVALTPEPDPRMATFLQKYICDPRKGIDRSWRSCQDKLLYISSPLTKILDLAEEGKISGTRFRLTSSQNGRNRRLYF
ncbi:hypothetical protein NDU88_001921 [Pleurodeles waltl]|uniref:Uncharacterized protein n=1 Tax=Pleurodeles waltl TaxID=8319 RepID=A0AAV7T1F5_PLEWA|nr:hypothetical protein NDU88_001921 [Pleurodeles waltl]